MLYHLILLPIWTHPLHRNLRIKVSKNRCFRNSCSQCFLHFLFLLWCIWPVQHSVCDSIFPLRLFSLRIPYRLTLSIWLHSFWLIFQVIKNGTMSLQFRFFITWSHYALWFPLLLYWLYYNPVHSPNNTHLHNTFTNSTAFFISSSFGCPLAIPPTSLNGPNVS